MTSAARRLLWLMPLLLTACVHNNTVTQVQPLAPPIEDAPPPPPDNAPNVLPAPVYSVPKTEAPVVVQKDEPKEPPKHHKTGSKSAPAQAPAPAPAPQVAEAAPPEVNAIGKFESPPDKPNSKEQAENSITDIEKGLSSIGRKLNESEEKTSMQIREFLKQARTALASGDLDGAKTLTTKAKALLGELNQ